MSTIFYNYHSHLCSMVAVSVINMECMLKLSLYWPGPVQWCISAGTCKM